MTRLLILCSVALLAGCRSGPTTASNRRPPHSRTASVAPKTTAVSKVLAVWSDAVLRQGDVPVAQGFTARVYLIDSATTEPAAADGTFRFYAFAEASSLSPQNGSIKPSQTWEFSAAEARPMLSKDPLGWGYSFWLPCGAPQNADRRFSLIARFTPDGGKPVASESTLVHIPTLGDSKVRGVTYRYEKSTRAEQGAGSQVANLGELASADDE